MLADTSESRRPVRMTLERVRSNAWRVSRGHGLGGTVARVGSEWSSEVDGIPGAESHASFICAALRVGRHMHPSEESVVFASWSSRGRPDLLELRKMLAPFGVHVYEDPMFKHMTEFGYMLSNTPLSEQRVRDISRNAWWGEDGG